MVEQMATILDIPVELRDNIAAQLDIRDVLSLSLVCTSFSCLPDHMAVWLMNDQTCKCLRAIIESRQTWIKSAQELQLQPQTSKMEEPFEDFTTQELRDWTLRRHKICRSLNSGSRATCRYIRGTDDVQKSVLLPGGRWLLFECSLGNIYYADGDAPRPEAQLLTSFEDAVPGHFRTQFVVWRDPDSPRLTFRVAFLYWYNRDDGNRGYQAHFCKIDLVGHGSSAELTARRIHLYQGSVPNGETSGEAIRGEYFYQIHHVQLYGVSPRLLNRRITLEILNYGNGATVARRVKLVDFYYSLHRWRLDVLPDGRIVVSGATEIDIYPDPLSIIGDEVKSLAPSLGTTQVGYAMRGGAVNMSRWYFGLDSHVAVYGASGKRMIAVWIPHDGAPPMKRTIKDFMPNDIGWCRLGLFHGMSMDSRGRINVVSYPWGDSQSQSGSPGITRRTFKIERDQNADILISEEKDYVVSDDVGEQDSSFDVNEEDSDNVEIRDFNEELGRAIIRDWHRGYFVLDIVQ